MILPKVRGVREAFHNPEMYEADSFFGIRRPRNKFRRGNKTSEYETTQPYMTRKPKYNSPRINCHQNHADIVLSGSYPPT